jgi:drug/metabolite transporter (DMT)-like permease
MIIALLIMLYSFTQPSIGQLLTLIALGVIGLSFGLNSWYKKIKKELDDEERGEET